MVSRLRISAQRRNSRSERSEGNCEVICWASPVRTVVPWRADNVTGSNRQRGYDQTQSGCDAVASPVTLRFLKGMPNAESESSSE